MSASPHSFIQSFEELPSTLPIFPLPNALMLPNGELPLNIFEPRYLNMIRDAMKGEQLIGMIQPNPASKNESDLYRVGCAGRIIRYEETTDGRLLVVLAGVCRFAVVEEVPTIRGYRMVIPDWSKFAHDYTPEVNDDPQTRLIFHKALRQHFDEHKIDTNLDSLSKLNLNQLMTSLFSYLPLSSEDRQLLIETEKLDEQLMAFAAILSGNSKNKQAPH